MDLTKLSEPFALEDIEWRVSRAGMGQKGIFCLTFSYITARAIQKRLDDVCGPENWKVEAPRMIDVEGKSAFAVGISINVGGDRDQFAVEWVTKWDVCEPTKVKNIDPAKGGFSGAMKRAGAEWGIGRYLYYLDETFAETAEQQPIDSARQWTWAKLSQEQGGAQYWWKTPSLPGWALPKEKEHEITEHELNDLKRAWRDKFAADAKNPSDLREGFSRFVSSIVGEFPSSDYTCWTRQALEQCQQRIEETTDAGGVDSDVPFDE